MHILTSLLKSLKSRFDDDMGDRLNYYYTCALIIVFAILVSAKQYVGYPIQCWVPAHFTEAMEQYTENYCWVQNTWFLRLDQHVPKKYQSRDEKQIIYYQWVPFILLLQALLFYVPSFLWRIMYGRTGLDIQNIVEMSSDARGIIDEPSRSKAVSMIAHYIHEALQLQQGSKHTSSAIGGNWKKTNSTYYAESPGLSKPYTDWRGLRKPLCGCYVTSLYLAIKLMYCCNIIGQYFMLNYLLGAQRSMFGFDLLRDLLNGKDWIDSGVFPRVTLCDFEVKVMGNLHRHTVQCVLMINMFNEKIFLFLWFWYIFVFFATLTSLWYWLISVVSSEKRSIFIGRYLDLYERPISERERSVLHKFVFRFLRHDGFFVLKFISSHAGDVILGEVTWTLWRIFKRRLRNLELDDYVLRKLDGEFSTVVDVRPPGLICDGSVPSGGSSDISSFKGPHA